MGQNAYVKAETVLSRQNASRTLPMEVGGQGEGDTLPEEGGGTR